MAQGEASSGLSIDDMHELLRSVGLAERTFLRELLSGGSPREAMVFAQLLHFFPGARLASDDPLGPP